MIHFIQSYHPFEFISIESFKYDSFHSIDSSIWIHFNWIIRVRFISFNRFIHFDHNPFQFINWNHSFKIHYNSRSKLISIQSSQSWWIFLNGIFEYWWLLWNRFITFRKKRPKSHFWPHWNSCFDGFWLKGHSRLQICAKRVWRASRANHSECFWGFHPCLVSIWVSVLLFDVFQRLSHDNTWNWRWFDVKSKRVNDRQIIHCACDVARFISYECLDLIEKHYE